MVLRPIQSLMAAQENTTTIPLGYEFRDWIRAQKRGQETYEEVLKRLLNYENQ